MAEKDTSLSLNKPNGEFLAHRPLMREEGLRWAQLVRDQLAFGLIDPRGDVSSSESEYEDESE